MKRILIGSLALFAPLLLAAQNPDLALTQAERDSILKTYDQIFPIWGRKAIERGFDLPTPLGFNIVAFGARQDILISDLGLGFNAPPQPVSFIKFSGAQAKLANFSVRMDLWVFPFLNVYTMLGKGPGRTTVHLSDPVTFSTKAEFSGTNFGLGFTGAFGIKRNFGVIDFNHQWAKSELLSAPVPVNVFSARLGRAFRIGSPTAARGQRMRGTVWIGAMFQSLKNETNGSIRLSDVVPGGTDSLFNNYQNSSWYQGLSPPEQAFVDNMVERLRGRLDTTVVSYSLNKKVADPWNMLVGGTFDYGRHWGLRAEVGFIGRVSALIMANYRVPL